ncbi:MAG TPA: hypothetical protein H9829_11475 [Candidatus Tetragenococcus pullicola]|nr:hypothetical protein [Candidatus Tetragenococcus pullicola]
MNVKMIIATIAYLIITIGLIVTKPFSRGVNALFLLLAIIILALFRYSIKKNEDK